MSGGLGSFCPLRKLGAPGEGRPLPFYSSSRLYSGSRGLTGLRSPNSHPVREAIQTIWRGQQHRLQKGNGTLCQGSLNGCERACVCQREIERENMCEAVSPETKKQEVTCEPWKGKGSAPRSGMRLAGCGGCLWKAPPLRCLLLTSETRTMDGLPGCPGIWDRDLHANQRELPGGQGVGWHPEPCVPLARCQVNSWGAASWWVACGSGNICCLSTLWWYLARLLPLCPAEMCSQTHTQVCPRPPRMCLQSESRGPGAGAGGFLHGS